MKNNFNNVNSKYLQKRKLDPLKVYKVTELVKNKKKKR